mmetsp:Transcript_2204/g.7902  ORF Transcript_2204/g.7902 Transcript_2204/m.7902 type:complete len:122 (-) Transcript_2204:219-584(-)
MARAIVTRCCSPPDNWLGRWSLRSPMPTMSSTSIARSRRSAADIFPARMSGISTFSTAVSEESRLNVWKTKPMSFKRRSERTLSAVLNAIRVRLMKSSPLVGLSMVPMMLRSDVLPPPDVP